MLSTFDAESFISEHSFNKAFLSSIEKLLKNEPHAVVKQDILTFKHELNTVSDTISKMDSKEKQKNTSICLLKTFIKYTNNVSKLMEHALKSPNVYNYYFMIIKIISQELGKLLKYSHIKKLYFSVLNHDNEPILLSLNNLIIRFDESMQLAEKKTEEMYYETRQKIESQHKLKILFDTKNLQEITNFLQNANNSFKLRGELFGEQKIIKEMELYAQILYFIETLWRYYAEYNLEISKNTNFLNKKQIVENGKNKFNDWQTNRREDFIIKNCHLMIKFLDNIDEFEKNKDDKDETNFDLKRCKERCYLNAIDYHFMQSVHFSMAKKTTEAFYHLNYANFLQTKLEKLESLCVRAKRTSLFFGLAGLYMMLGNPREGVAFFEKALALIEEFHKEHSQIKNYSKNEILSIALKNENYILLQFLENLIQVVKYCSKAGLLKEAKDISEQIIKTAKKQIELYSSFHVLIKTPQGLDKNKFSELKQAKINYLGDIYKLESLMNDLNKEIEKIKKFDLIKNISRQIQEQSHRDVSIATIGDINKLYIKIDYKHPFKFIMPTNQSLAAQIKNLYKDIADVEELKPENNQICFKITLHRSFKESEIVNKILKKEVAVNKIVNNLNNPKQQLQTTTQKQNETSSNSEQVTNNNTLPLNENLKDNSSKNDQQKTGALIENDNIKIKKNVLLTQENTKNKNLDDHENILNYYQKDHIQHQIRKKIENNTNTDNKEKSSVICEWSINSNNSPLSSFTFFNRNENDMKEEKEKNKKNMDINKVAKTIYPISNAVVSKGTYFLKFDEKFLNEHARDECTNKYIRLAEEGKIVAPKKNGVVLCSKEIKNKQQLIKIRHSRCNNRFYATDNQAIPIKNNFTNEETTGTLFTINLDRIHR